MHNPHDLPVILISDHNDDPIDNVAAQAATIIEGGSILSAEEIDFFEIFVIAVPFNQAFEPTT